MKTMKKTVAAAVAALSFAGVAFAEQLDHWEFNTDGNTITDGEWTFTVARRGATEEVAEGVFGLYVLACTEAPSSLATLDFGKAINDYQGTKYAITRLGSYGNWMTNDQKLMIERLVLPTGVPFQIDKNSAFSGCTNLKEVTPFLSDSCYYIGRGAFQNCSSITNALVIKGFDDGTKDVWECFEGCSSIPSADLSESKMTALSRHFFYNCSSLEWVKLPATLDHLSASSSVDVFGGATSLRRVEMNSSVDGFLNLFPKAATALSEIHFYNCMPNETKSVLSGISDSQLVTTYLHDMTADQLAAWAACTEGGVLTTKSTWSSALAGAKAYANRPLVVYAEPHAQIAAGQDAVVLDGQNGTFSVSRGESDPCVGDLVVNFAVSGDAEEGTHYTALPKSITIPHGEASATISVSGRYTGAAFEKDLVLTLTSGDYEIIEEKSSATISVLSGYRGVSVLKIKDANKELGQVGAFRVSRGASDSTAGDLVVALEYSGTAGNGTTYRELPTSVTIPAGKSYVDFEIFPLDDASVTADSQAIIKIGTGLYTVEGEPATVTIEYGNGVWGCWRIFDDNGTKKITDGTWTFKCALQGVKVSTDDAYRLDVKEATAWPTKVSPLDFTKGFDNVFGGLTYKIGNWEMKFGTVNGYVATPTAAGDKVGRVTLSDGLHDASIVQYAFSGCTNMVFSLENMPTNITVIANYAFMGSSAAGVLDAPRMTSIGVDAFYGCTGLTAVKASKLATIGERAFQKATSLKSVDLGPDDECVLTSIGQYAFDSCAALESFTPFLPSSLDTLNTRGTFMGCANLTNALQFVGSNLGEEHSFGGAEIFKNCAKIPSADLSKSTIKSLRREVFCACSALEWVKLPSTLEEFGDPACKTELWNRSPFGGTMSVKLYLSGTNLPYKVGWNTKTLVEIPMDIPEVSAIEFSTNLTTIAAGAFANTEYSKLTEIKFAGAKPTTIGADIFAGQKKETITAYVPSDDAKVLAGWNTVEGVEGPITKVSGTWTSGTTQNIRSYRLKMRGVMLLMK